MKRYWIGWNQHSDDYRPLTWPVGAGLRAYWCSGEAADYHTMCAVVDACDEEDARLAVKLHWPEAGEFRFCDEKPSGWRPSDRFPWPSDDWTARNTVHGGT